jgi:hypothetical protein
MRERRPRWKVGDGRNETGKYFERTRTDKRARRETNRQRERGPGVRHKQETRQRER